MKYLFKALGHFLGLLGFLSIAACSADRGFNAELMLTVQEISKTASLEFVTEDFSISDTVHSSCTSSRQLLEAVYRNSPIASSNLRLGDGSIFQMHQAIFQTEGPEEAVLLIQNLSRFPDDNCFGGVRNASATSSLSRAFNTKLEGIYWTESYFDQFRIKGVPSFDIEYDGIRLFAIKDSSVYTLYVSTEPAAEITKNQFRVIAQTALDKLQD